MSETIIPQEILVIVGSRSAERQGGEPRRGSVVSSLLNTQQANIIQLQEQVNVFIQQIDVMMSKAPEKVGEFRLAEFEVSAGITFGGKGELKLALLGSGEINGGVNASLKFVFKRA
jgi:hypothetical protein